MIDPREESGLARIEREVKKEFGKAFDARSAASRREETLRYWSRFDLANKTVLDVGAGHPVVPALLTSIEPTLRVDAVDVSPDFEAHAPGAIRALGGDPACFRFVTADFYDIARLAQEGALRRRYDFVLLIETLHHSLRKSLLLRTLTQVMDAGSLMVLLEPALPVIGRRRAYDESRWARDLGYIEEPVTMSEYRRAFREAGLDIVSCEYERSRETGPRSWKRRLFPAPMYDVYRNRVRALWALTSFTIVCKKAGGR
ncbi:class I SAM-dependent methyltransferase [bacterium]|nr:class I SAM-dependent methyltransferase [bacterium]